MKHNQKGQIWIIVVLALVLIIASVFYFASSGFQEKPSVKVDRFEVSPSEFKTSQTSELYIRTENLVENDFSTVTLHLETHKNVKIYLGDSLLLVQGGNYTYTKVLNPKETSSFVFKLKATVDIGDNLRHYQVKAYIYVNGGFFTSKVAPFSVYADD